MDADNIQDSQKSQQPTYHLLQGSRDRSLVVTAQQMKVKTAMAGIARPTGTRGCATSPPIIRRAIGPRKNRCIRASSPYAKAPALP